MSKPDVKAFFDEDTFTISYVVSDPGTHRAVIIDPVRDYEPKSGRTGTSSADAMIEFIKDAGLQVDWILETHVHADHLSGAPLIKKALGGEIAIGRKVGTVQNVFRTIFNIDDLPADGSLGDLQFRRGPREVEVPGRRLEGYQRIGWRQSSTQRSHY